METHLPKKNPRSRLRSQSTFNLIHSPVRVNKSVLQVGIAKEMKTPEEQTPHTGKPPAVVLEIGKCS